MLTFDFVDWDDERDPNGNVQHIAAHNLTTEEVEDVLYSPAIKHGHSRTTGQTCVWGRTSTNRHIIVIYRLSESGGWTTIRPVTAYDVPA